MASRTEITLVFLLAVLSMVFAGSAAAALTTEDLVRLKTAGVSEDLIRLIVENGYSDVGRVVKLKEAGFRDETILSVVTSDLKEVKAPSPTPVAQPAKAAPDPVVDIQTPAKVKIERYLVHGDPILQNSQEIANATVALAGRRITFEWPTRKLLDLIDIFEMNPFAPPFVWDLSREDKLRAMDGRNAGFVLTSTRSHQGRPTTDDTHYWVVSIEPQNPVMIQQVRKALAE
jgi:hypothetical protein